MRKLTSIRLEYTKDEINKILQTAISQAEKVSITSVKVEGDKYILDCIDGINTVVSNIDILQDRTKQNSVRATGLKDAIFSILEGNVKCPIDVLVKELNLKGFHKDKTYIRNYLVYKTMSKYVLEVEPNVFTRKVEKL